MLRPEGYTGRMRGGSTAGEPRRHFEDFSAGQVVELGSVQVSAEEIVAFARQFDPQPFHLDPAAARDSIYGGLIASGLHTASLFTRLFVAGVLNGSRSLGSPGFEQIRWPAPVRPDDTIRARWTVLACRASRSKPERGIVRGHGEMLNQRNEIVLSIETANFIGRRSASDP